MKYPILIQHNKKQARRNWKKNEREKTARNKPKIELTSI